MRVGGDVVPVIPRVVIPEKVQKPLNEAERVFAAFISATQAEKDSVLANLQEAFVEMKYLANGDGTVPKYLEQTAARIFYLYGRCLYGDMPKSRRLFELSFAVQLVGLGILQKSLPYANCPFEVLFEWLDKKPLLVAEMEALLLYSDTTELAKEILTKSEGKASENLTLEPSDEWANVVLADFDSQLQTTGETLRYLGQSFQSLAAFGNASQQARFEKIYGLADAIFVGLNTPDSNWERGELVYHTGRFRHRLQHPHDHIGATNTLQEAIRYVAADGGSLRAKVRIAQIYNITAIEHFNVSEGVEDPVFKRNMLEFCYDQVTIAAQMANVIPGFDPFLRSMMINNRLSFGLSCLGVGSTKVTVAEIRTWVNEVMAAIKADSYSHYYHTSFLLNAANFAIGQNLKEEARSYLDLAAILIKKFPGTLASANDEKKMNELRGWLATL